LGKKARHNYVPSTNFLGKIKNRTVEFTTNLNAQCQMKLKGWEIYIHIYI